MGKDGLSLEIGHRLTAVWLGGISTEKLPGRSGRDADGFLKRKGGCDRFMNIMDEDVLIALNFSIDGIFVENTNGDILMCNQAGADMFGYTIEEITKLNIRDLVPSTEGYYLREQYTSSDLFPDEYIGRLNIKKDGTLIRTEINSKIIVSNGQEYLIAFVRDATEPAHLDPNDPKFRMSAENLAHRRLEEEQISLVLHDSVKREKFVVPLKNVEYMESNLKKLRLYLTNGTVLEGYDTLNQLQSELIPDGSFLRCHQSYIVNLKCAELDEHLLVFVMRSGAQIPIRKKQYSQMKQAYYNYKILMQ